jgi:hypothetical protein
VTIGGNIFNTGDLAPNGQAVFDLGSSGARWRRVHLFGLRVYGEETVAVLGMNKSGWRVTNVTTPSANADAATKNNVTTPSPASRPYLAPTGLTESYVGLFCV